MHEWLLRRYYGSLLNTNDCNIMQIIFPYRPVSPHCTYLLLLLPSKDGSQIPYFEKAELWLCPLP